MTFTVSSKAINDALTILSKVIASKNVLPILDDFIIRVINNVDTMTYTYYQNNVKPKADTKGKKGFVCKVCGYVYEGDVLPDDFVCPLCKHGAADFEEIK